MGTRKNSTQIGVKTELSRDLVKQIDMIANYWKVTRRDAVEILTSYSFFLFEQDGNPRVLPPGDFVDKRFIDCVLELNEEREKEEAT